ncbi:MAG: DUF4421 domain-containing protein [Muribaculaceae bacterium]|nr:DUF4421 domain-containing protein [Muribaculaceae bacterium]
MVIRRLLILLTFSLSFLICSAEKETQLPDEGVPDEEYFMPEETDDAEPQLNHNMLEDIKESSKSAHTDPNRDWWHLLKKGYFNPKDTTVKYSKFMKLFCDVYVWGDRVFNTYDSTYVVGFGKNWKARLAFDTWTDSYYMNFNNNLPMVFISEPYSSLGAYLHFMAVSVNYSVDINKVLFGRPVNHKKFEFGFNCARFNIDLSFSSNVGGTYIRKFGDYEKHKPIRMFFPGVRTNTLNFAIYYFFNNRKYANGAAYNFSRQQLKSAGSPILGFNYGHLNTYFNFASLPEQLLPYLTLPETRYKFHYNDYCLLMGYAYNWVWNKHLLYNITVMPSIGITKCYEDSYDGAQNLLSLNALGRMSFTYNLNDLFVCLIAKANLQWFSSGKLTLFSGIENLSLSVGYRF